MKHRQLDYTSFNTSDAILEHLLDAVLIVDQRGTIIYANKAAETLFSKPAPDLLGQNFGFPIAPGEVDEIQLFCNGQWCTVQVLASQICLKNEDAYLLSLRDITALKTTTEELWRQKARLEKRGEELELYASLASHDLKEPIRKILLYTDKLLRQAPAAATDGTATVLEKIQAAAHRMQQLISGIAEFSKLAREADAFVPTDLGKIVQEVCTDLELQIEEKDARLHIAPLPRIEAIPVQMHQLFLNLLSNALKYSRQDVPPRIHITVEETNGDLVAIRIADNGIGLDNRFAEKIFQPFARLHGKQYDGSGIGLAICKKIAEGHGGTISVWSTPGEGSVFLVQLQRTHPKHQQHQPE